MILGSVCTRGCSFCGVKKGEPQPVDREEPERVALAAGKLGLKHVVVTSVTRDDLHDGGAEQFEKVVNELRKIIPPVSIEVLTPDFKGIPEAILRVAAAGADVYNHNVETVPRLYPDVRPQADYRRSLSLLKLVKEEFPHSWTKSGIMLGLGEHEDEVMTVFEDLRRVRCDILTIGQYLKPAPESHPVERFVPPEEFEAHKNKALNLGFRHVFSGPFVRSSYHARLPVNPE
jgi:lipoic acid synthetase